jgi:hypothetical protein
MGREKCGVGKRKQEEVRQTEAVSQRISSSETLFLHRVVDVLYYCIRKQHSTVATTKEHNRRKES